MWDQSVYQKVILWTNQEEVCRFLGDLEWDLTNKYKSRSHSKEDTIKEHKICARINRLNKLLQEYMVQEVKFTTPFNCTYVKWVKSQMDRC